MPYPKEIISVVQDLSNSVSAIEMELHLLEIQQTSVKHAISA